MFDERLWLAWLVKVRIIILTFLLGIELAICAAHSHTFAAAAVCRYHSAVVHDLDFLHCAAFVLAGVPHSGGIAGAHRSVLVTLVVYATGGVDSSLNFLYPLVIIVASILLPRVWAYLTAALAFILYGTFWS